MSENLEPKRVDAPKMKAPVGEVPPQVRQRGDWSKKNASQIMKTTRELLHEQDKARIIIPSTEKDKEDVPVQINGYCYLIKRDVAVDVPLAVVEVLDHARMTTYTQRPRTNGEGNEMVPQEVLRIPYQRVS